MPQPAASTADAQASTPEVRGGAAVTAVFVVDKHGNPLMPTRPGKARVWLASGRAEVVRLNPFTIRLRDREGGNTQPIELKIDPGSKTTGLALTVLGKTRGWFVISAWELIHRGRAIRDGLLARAQLRRGRRGRKTRYRQARFLNRARSKQASWLPSSLRSRVDNVMAFANKIHRCCPVTSLPIEQVRFDTQLMQNPDVTGVLYQQGTLKGYEVREYLLEKWGRKCCYCQAKDVPLQIEHLIPRSQGGTDRVSNLTLACNRCNQKKGNRPLEEFLKTKPDLLRRLKAQAKAPLQDTAAVNSARKALVEALQIQFPHLAVTTHTGGRTKFNRTQQGYAKAHWVDAACVGPTGQTVDLTRLTHVTTIQAKGRGSRQMCKPDKFGFPRTQAKSVKRIHGFQTGDRVKLVQPSGKYQGLHEGVVSIRANGTFDILTTKKLKVSAPHARFALLQRFDGHAYSHRRSI